MKHKRFICLALVFIIAFSVFSVITHFISAASAPILSIVPTGHNGATSTTDIAAQTVGTTFSVDVRVDDYADVNIGGPNSGVSDCSYTVTWDPTVLEYTSYTDGSWLPTQSNIGDLTTQVTEGQLTIGQIAFDLSDASATADSSTGSVSATITFTVLSTGSSALTLQPSSAGVAYLEAPDTVGGVTSNYPVTGTTTVNAQYGPLTSPTPTPTTSPGPSPTPTSPPSPSPTPTTSPSPSPTPTPSQSTHGPQAIISIQNGTIFATGEQILLDGSSSTPGYDAESCPITNYAWLVQYPNGTPFGAFSGQTISIVVNTQTYLNVSLIVTAPDKNPSPSPKYDNTSLASVWIYFETPPHAQIDLFTNKGGIGPNVSSDAYGPQELILMYANVTYNHAAVVNKEVTFTVLSPNGTIAAVVTALTNSTGIASQEYRTPWIGTSNFGIWTIIASVDVSQVVVTDTTTFTYNYLITTNGITLPASVSRGFSMTVTVNIASIENSTLWATTTITLYDAENVPIGSYVVSNPNQEVGTAKVSATFTIPSWAFVGTATVYVNILTNTPTAGGVAYSPEKTANFQILS